MVILFLVLLCFLQINQDCECKAIETVVSKCLIERITKSIKVLGEDKDIIGCIPCQPCPPGQEPYLACGSVISMKYIFNIRCSSCPNGTYSDSYSRSSCKACKKCDRESIEVGKCTRSTNTVCLPRKSHCKRGFYFSEIFSVCLPCSRCCGDSKDIKIDECVTQGSQSKKLCSIHSIHRCSKDSNITTSTPQSVGKRINSNLPDNTDVTIMRTTSTTPSNNRSNTASWRNKKNNLRKYGTKESSLPMISLGILSFFVLVLIIILVFKIKSTRKNPEAGCFSMRLTKTNKKIFLSDKCKSDQSDELEDWSSNDVSNSTYSFKCGVLVKYQPHSKQDRYKSLIVEALSKQAMDSHFRSIEPEQVFLSPIYRFYTQGEKFEEPVKIILPHSALYTSDQKNWDVEILCMDERKGKEAKWERITDGLEVNWKDTSFHTDTLLTYAVVGTPLKGAKKRMQLVLFTTGEMISDLFEVCIHLLDDNETSFQNVLKESSSKGFTMLGSFYAAFVDCQSSVNIDLNVEGLVDGWELNRLKPKTIASFECKESYFSIPSFQAAFRRVKRHADKFSCKFRIDVAGTEEIIIPAFTFVPEEELCVVVDVHEQDHDTSVLKEKKTPFKDLHYDTKYVLGRMLDVSVKGQGTWRQLGRHFRLTDDEVEQFAVEYRTLEGSPSRALFDYLSITQPNITVGEFAKCLESLGREDVMAVLYKHLKKKPLNTKI